MNGPGLREVFDVDNHFTVTDATITGTVVNAAIPLAIRVGVAWGWIVTAGTGRTVSISAGSGGVGTTPFGAPAYTDAIPSYGGPGGVGLEANRGDSNPIYLFVLPIDRVVNNSTTPPTLVTPGTYDNRKPLFDIGNAPTRADGVLLARITTTANGIANVTDMRRFQQFDGAGQLTKDVTGGSDAIYTDAEAANFNQDTTGTLTANINAILPALPRRMWRFANDTTGGFTITVKTPSGTGVVIAPGTRQTIESDGTNVVMAPTTPESTQSANVVRAGPASGAAANPTYRALVGADLPTADTTNKGAVVLSADRGTTAGRTVQASDGRLAPFGASGTNHATGLVPDPGATGGTTRFLREDGTFAIPTTATTLFLPNQTSAPAAPTAGVILFAQGGVLKCIVPSGTVTTLAS